MKGQNGSPIGDHIERNRWESGAIETIDMARERLGIEVKVEVILTKIPECP